MVSGHLQVKKGHYYIVLSYYDNKNKRHVKYVSTGLPEKGNKRKAEAELARIRNEFEPPLEVGELASDMSFADYLLEWLDIVKVRVKATTFSSYEQMVKSVIEPYFRKKAITLQGLEASIEGEYDSSIFTAEKATQSFDKAFLAKKAIQDYVFTDGSAEKSIERKFAEDLDAADEVCVYAKLPRTFQIPTPVGNYSPDWAIAFYEGKVKHIFFIAETKGTMESLELRPIEQAKISCAKKLFNEMSASKVKYHDVDSYQSLLNVINAM